MNRLSTAVCAGAVGSLTTNVLHELTRRYYADAPRIDILGMQALAKSLAALEIEPPTGRALYRTTLAADLISNAGYFSLAGLAPEDGTIGVATLLGLAAGIGAVRLPPQLGLAETPTNRTAFTRAASVALYTIGGFATGCVLRLLSTARGDDARFLGGKHVVVTGGSRGLGFVLARRMLEAGARVTICGRSTQTLAAAKTELGRYGAALATVAADVTVAGDCERLLHEAVVLHGPVDVLVNNAGVIEVGPAVEATIADYREALDTHFWGPLNTTLAVLPAMRARGCGHIVNVASIGGVVGIPHLAPYCASKFAQIGLTQALGAELAADGIRMTSIVPGLMITGSTEHAVFKGRNRAEYAWFALSDANPILSVSAEAAAARIVRAMRRGEAQAVIGTTAKIAKTLGALFPQTTARLLRLAASLLPKPGGIGTERRTGEASRSAWTQNPLTALDTAAAQRNNENANAPHTS